MEPTTFLTKKSKVKSQKLINLDGSNDEVVLVGGDGDICHEYAIKGIRANSSSPCYKIKIGGFVGGNSGDNIEASARNAITTMAKLLYGKELLLAEIRGGTSDNDLATFCEVIISTNEDVRSIFEGLQADIRKNDSVSCFDKNDTRKIIHQILDLRCGFISEDKTSANLGMIETDGDEVKMRYVFRGMNKNELERTDLELRNLENGFTVKELYRDPVWKVDEDSKVLDMYRRIYFKQYGKYPVNEICRGSIECATIKNHIKNLDIISIGSNIESYHTTEEATYISSWCKVFNLIIELLKSL